jgi:hypothetical protein
MFGLIGGIFKFTTSFTTTFDTTASTSKSTTTTFATTQSTTTTYNTTKNTTTTFSTSKSTSTTFSTSKNTSTTYSTSFNTNVTDNRGPCWASGYCGNYDYQYTTYPGAAMLCVWLNWGGTRIRGGNCMYNPRYAGSISNLYEDKFPYTTGGYTYEWAPGPGWPTYGSWCQSYTYPSGGYARFAVCRKGSYNQSTSKNTSKNTTTTYNTSKNTTTTYNTTRSTVTTFSTSKSTTTTFNTTQSTTTTYNTTSSTSRTTTRVTDFYS